METINNHNLLNVSQVELILMQNEYFIARVAILSDVACAQDISRWIALAGSSNMIPKTPDQIVEMFAQGDSVLVTDNKTGKVIGHTGLYHRGCGGYFHPEKEKIEIGSLCIDPEEKGRGAGTLAVEAALRLAGVRYPDRIVFAMSNQNSLRIFIDKVGGLRIDCSRIDADIWNHCEGCPRGSNDSTQNLMPCRHTPVELTHLLENYQDELIS